MLSLFFFFVFFFLGGVWYWMSNKWCCLMMQIPCESIFVALNKLRLLKSCRCLGRRCQLCKYMGVSKNRGTPKWMVFNGKPYWNGWFGGTTIFGNTHTYIWVSNIRHLFVLFCLEGEWASSICFRWHSMALDGTQIGFIAYLIDS